MSCAYPTPRLRQSQPASESTWSWWDTWEPGAWSSWSPHSTHWPLRMFSQALHAAAPTPLVTHPERDPNWRRYSRRRPGLCVRRSSRRSRAAPGRSADSIHGKVGQLCSASSRRPGADGEDGDEGCDDADRRGYAIACGRLSANATSRASELPLSQISRQTTSRSTQGDPPPTQAWSRLQGSRSPLPSSIRGVDRRLQQLWHRSYTPCHGRSQSKQS